MTRLPLLLVTCLPLLAVSAEDPAVPWPILKPAADSAPLPGTGSLTLEGDLSHQLVLANDAFLDRQIAAAAAARDALWKSGEHEPDEHSVRLATMLGLHRDSRPESVRFEYYSVQKAQKAVAEGVVIYQVRWEAVEGLHGEGLLLEPEGKDHPAGLTSISIL